MKNIGYEVNKKGCWIYQGIPCSSGYGHIKKNGVSKGAHRVFYERKFGKIKNKTLLVCHKCNIKLCVNPDHLYLASHAKNIQDAARDGLMVGNSKLNKTKIKKIRHLWHVKNKSYSEIAAMFSINQSHVGRIINKKAWKF